MPPAALVQLWQHAAAYVAESVLEGVARVRKCTLEGRAAMSVDLSVCCREHGGIMQFASLKYPVLSLAVHDAWHDVWT